MLNNLYQSHNGSLEGGRGATCDSRAPWGHVLNVSGINSVMAEFWTYTQKPTIKVHVHFQFLYMHF
jgi:hypothetical protein